MTAHSSPSGSEGGGNADTEVRVALSDGTSPGKDLPPALSEGCSACHGGQILGQPCGFCAADAAQREAYAEGRKDEREDLVNRRALIDCPYCNGSGERDVSDTTRGPEGGTYFVNCPDCDGTGFARWPLPPGESAEARPTDKTASAVKALRESHQRLAEALRPFANYACDPPCNCHNCTARAALASIKE